MAQPTTGQPPGNSPPEAAPLPPPPPQAAASIAMPRTLALRHTLRLLRIPRLEERTPREARVVEVVAQQAIGGHLPFDGARPAMAFAARLDRRHRDVARLLRFRHVVAIGAGRLRVGLVVEIGARHPAMARAHRGDLPFGPCTQHVAGLAYARLEELLRDLLRLARRERERRLPLAGRRLAHAPQQSLAGRSERLLETVGRALE